MVYIILEKRYNVKRVARFFYTVRLMEVFMKQVIILYADGFEEVEGVTPPDYLRRAGITVTAVSCSDSLEVTGAHGLKIVADKTIGGALGAKADAVVCPGGMPGASNIAASAGAVELIQKIRKAGGITAALCASPIVVFAKLGLLTGKTFTCFPGIEAAAEKWAGPDYQKLLAGSTKTMNAVEIDGKVITGQGPGAAEEFSLALIGALEGKTAADAVQKDSWLRQPRA
jgi:4-methyl-5(b-hydroxyethyl)-thiazole monophosphate biosynthesis